MASYASVSDNIFIDLVFKQIQIVFKFRKMTFFKIIFVFYCVCIILFVLYSALICIAGVCAI